MGGYLSSDVGPLDPPDDATRCQIRTFAELAVEKYKRRREEAGPFAVQAATNRSILRAKLIYHLSSPHLDTSVNMLEIQSLDRLRAVRRQNFIQDSYTGSSSGMFGLGPELKQKALLFVRRRRDALSKQPNLCVYGPCPYANCMFRHVPSLDEYSRNYITSVQEAKRLGLSPWVYFAQRFKQDLV